MKKTMVNCWEFMNCGLDPRGEQAQDRGVCPAATITTFHGVNRGKNAGRFCWNISGTYCNGRIQGLFAAKLNDCLECEFLKQVQQEEGSDFRFLTQ